MREELKPCPFCGCEHMKISPNIHTQMLRVQCEGCWATSVTSNNRATIIAAWNRRASPTPPTEGEGRPCNSHSRLVVAAANLLQDVFARHPGETLRCPYMVELHAAVADAEATRGSDLKWEEKALARSAHGLSLPQETMQVARDTRAARALLSSSATEDVRREALEEAARIVEAMSPTYVSNGRRFLKENGAALDELAPHLEAQRVAKLQLQGEPDINEFEKAAAAIRSLSPPDGDGKEQATRAATPSPYGKASMQEASAEEESK